MNKREDYEHIELDLDGNYYYFTNKGFSNEYEEPKLKDFLQWWRTSERNEGLYYKGTRLYFTLDNKKYYLTWTFYNEDRLKLAIKKLKALNCINIQINYGELD